MTDKTDADGGPAFPVEKIIPLGDSLQLTPAGQYIIDISAKFGPTPSPSDKEGGDV